MMEQRSVGVSVIMPAFNAERTITQAIASVLNQTYRELELIIIDDCSSDATAAICKERMERDARVRYLRNESNVGVALSRNLGVSMARCPWIAFLDSDDLWRSDKLERQCAAVEAQPEAVLCFTGSSFIDDAGNPSGYILQVPEKITYRQLLKQNLISCSSVLVKTDVIRGVPMCRDRDMHEDYAAWLSILKQTSWAIGVDLPLLTYRVSSGSKSGNKLKAARMQWRTYRYVGLPAWESAFYFCHYTIRNLRKYGSIRKMTERSNNDAEEIKL